MLHRGIELEMRGVLMVVHIMQYNGDSFETKK